jgi:hypothetical protein
MLNVAISLFLFLSTSYWCFIIAAAASTGSAATISAPILLEKLEWFASAGLVLPRKDAPDFLYK